jgi:hypothetical protein
MKKLFAIACMLPLIFFANMRLFSEVDIMDLNVAQIPFKVEKIIKGDLIKVSLGDRIYFIICKKYNFMNIKSVHSGDQNKLKEVVLKFDSKKKFNYKNIELVVDEIYIDIFSSTELITLENYLDYGPEEASKKMNCFDNYEIKLTKENFPKISNEAVIRKKIDMNLYEVLVKNQVKMIFIDDNKNNEFKIGDKIYFMYKSISSSNAVVDLVYCIDPNKL